MNTLPEPALWKTSGFWAAIYMVVMLYAVVRETWGKDEAARRRILRRVLLAAGAVWLALHAMALLGISSGYRLVQALGARATSRDWAVAWRDALQISAGAWALLGVTVAAAGVFAAPPRKGRALPWEGLAFAAVLVLAVHLVPVEAAEGRQRFLYAEPIPAWIERACDLGALMTLVAGPFAITRGAQFWRSGGADPVGKERQRSALVFWGFLLFVGAVLILEKGTMGLMKEVAILGPRFGGWGVVHDAFFRIARLPAVLGLLGLLALCFGAVHLKRRDGAPEGGS